MAEKGTYKLRHDCAHLRLCTPIPYYIKRESAHRRRRMAVDGRNSLINDLFGFDRANDPFHHGNGHKNGGLDRCGFVHREFTDATKLPDGSLMTGRNLCLSVVTCVMEMDSFECKHRREHCNQCPSIDTFYRLSCFHLCPYA